MNFHQEFNKQPAGVDFSKNNAWMCVLLKCNNQQVLITPDNAKFLLQSANFPEQRLIDQGRLYQHQLNISNGYWLNEHIITFAQLPDGRLWLVDGQHRLLAIVQERVALTLTIRIVKVASENDARIFYVGFDQSTSTRSIRQVIQAMKVHIHTGLTLGMALAVYNSSILLSNRFEPLIGRSARKKKPMLFLQQNRLEAITRWAIEARLYQQVIASTTGSMREKMMGAVMTAVALYTLHHQPYLANKFWYGLIKNDGLPNTDPRSALYNQWLATDAPQARLRQRVQQIAAAWNAYYQKCPLRKIECIDGAPIVLLGTPLKH